MVRPQTGRVELVMERPRSREEMSLRRHYQNCSGYLGSSVPQDLDEEIFFHLKMEEQEI